MDFSKSPLPTSIMHMNRSRIPPQTPIRPVYQRGQPFSLPRWTPLVQTPSTASTNEMDELDETPAMSIKKRPKKRKPPSRAGESVPQLVVQPPTPFLEPPVPVLTIQPNNLLQPPIVKLSKKSVKNREGSPLSEKAERVRRKAERNEAKKRKAAAVQRMECVEIPLKKKRTVLEPFEVVREKSSSIAPESQKRKRDETVLTHTRSSEDLQSVAEPPPKKSKPHTDIVRDDAANQATQSKVSAPANSITPKNDNIRRKRRARRNSRAADDSISSSKSPSTRSSSPLETNDGAVPTSNGWDAISSRMLMLQKEPEVAASMQAFCKLPVEECKEFFTAISMKDWPIPTDVKSQFDSIARKMFRNVSEDMLFKHRTRNDFRFFLHLIDNPRKYGLSRNFPKNFIKLVKMRSMWGKSISEARRNIVTRVKMSIENKDALSVLVRSLYGDETNCLHTNMSVVLRHVLREKGRSKEFFDHVDNKLLEIRASKRPQRNYRRLIDNDVQLHEPTA